MTGTNRQPQYTFAFEFCRSKTRSVWNPTLVCYVFFYRNEEIVFFFVKSYEFRVLLRHEQATNVII